MDEVYPDTHMVCCIVAGVTSGLLAPGVMDGFGSQAESPESDGGVGAFTIGVVVEGGSDVAVATGEQPKVQTRANNTKSFFMVLTFFLSHQKQVLSSMMTIRYLWPSLWE
jgi:hypothetical protein